MAKRTALNLTRALSIIAGVVFWFTPLHTGTQWLLFAASVIFFIICTAISGNLDDRHTGYWPGDPKRIAAVGFPRLPNPIFSFPTAFLSPPRSRPAARVALHGGS